MKLEIDNNAFRALLVLAIIIMAYFKVDGYGWLIFFLIVSC